jgi:hypothetical protein
VYVLTSRPVWIRPYRPRGLGPWPLLFCSVSSQANTRVVTAERLLNRLLNSLLKFLTESRPQMRVGFDQPCNVNQVLDPSTLTAFGGTPRFHLSLKRVVKRCHSEQNSMDIRRHGAGWKFLIEILGAELEAHAGMADKINRRSKPFGLKTGFRQNLDGGFHGLGGDDEIHIPSYHRLCGPMIDRHSPDGAPRDVCTLQAIYKPHDVICSPGGLPVVKLFCCHISKMQEFKGLARISLGWPLH